MKKLATVLAVGLALSSAAAMASNGTVTINGKLTADSCLINGGATHDFVVTLPTLSTNTMTTAGKTAGTTKFQMDLSGCSSSITGVSAFFENSTNVTTNNNLKNLAATPAGQVEVQLLNKNGVALDLNKGSGAQGDIIAVPVSGNATLEYYAQYYATGATTAGDVTASTVYSLVYQ